MSHDGEDCFLLFPQEYEEPDVEEFIAQCIYCENVGWKASEVDTSHVVLEMGGHFGNWKSKLFPIIKCHVMKRARQ